MSSSCVLNNTNEMLQCYSSEYIWETARIYTLVLLGVLDGILRYGWASIIYCSVIYVVLYAEIAWMTRVALVNTPDT